MSSEPQTSEEYIEMVTKQAVEQESEHVPSHKELVENYRSKSQSYQEKEFFYTILLILLIVSFMVVKMFPEALGLPSKKGEL